MKVSVAQAIRRGKLLVSYMIPAGIVAGGLLGAIGMHSIKVIDINIPCFLLGGLAGALLGGYIGNMLFPKWLLWAYVNVDDLYELKKTAETEGLWQDEQSWLGKKSCSATENKKIAEIYKELAQLHTPRAGVDDPTVPNEVKIMYSIPYIISISGFATLSTFALAYPLSIIVKYGPDTMVTTTNFSLACASSAAVIALLISLGLFGVLKGTRTPLMVISSRGIEIRKNGFWTWADIKEEEVKIISSSRSMDYSIVRFQTANGQVSFSLFGKTVGSVRMNHLLIVYRRRHEAQAN